MRLHYPLNSNGAEDAGQLPWTDGVPSTGVEGSYPGHAIVTDVEAEILAAIDASGLVRNGEDLTQLIQAISRGIWLGQLGGTSTALTATVPNGAVIPSLQGGMRVRGIAASNFTGTGGTLAITGIGAAGNTVSYPLVASDGVTPLAAGAWSAGQFLTFDIDASGNARFGSGTGTGNSISIAQAAKSYFNVVPFKTSNRVSTSGSVANQQSQVWSVGNYTKKSATSLIEIGICFQTRINFVPPGNGSQFGASQIVINVGPQSTVIGISNAYPAFSYNNAASLPFAGLGVGTYALNVGLQRPDSNAWANVFNPTAAEDSTFPAVNTAFLVAREVEPT